MAKHKHNNKLPNVDLNLMQKAESLMNVIVVSHHTIEVNAIKEISS